MSAVNQKEMIKNVSEEYKIIGYLPIYGEIAGSILGGVFLSQVMYWLQRQDVFYKTDKDFSKELNLTISTFKRLKQDLKEIPFLNIEAKGCPIKTFYSLDTKEYQAFFKKLKEEEDTKVHQRVNIDTKKSNNSPQTKNSPKEEEFSLLIEALKKEAPKEYLIKNNKIEFENFILIDEKWEKIKDDYVSYQKSEKEFTLKLENYLKLYNYEYNLNEINLSNSKPKTQKEKDFILLVNALEEESIKVHLIKNNKKEFKMFLLLEDSWENIKNNYLEYQSKNKFSLKLENYLKQYSYLVKNGNRNKKESYSDNRSNSELQTEQEKNFICLVEALKKEAPNKNLIKNNKREFELFLQLNKDWREIRQNYIYYQTQAGDYAYKLENFLNVYEMLKEREFTNNSSKKNQVPQKGTILYDAMMMGHKMSGQQEEFSSPKEEEVKKEDIVETTIFEEEEMNLSHSSEKGEDKKNINHSDNIENLISSIENDDFRGNKEDVKNLIEEFDSFYKNQYSINQRDKLLKIFQEEDWETKIKFEKELKKFDDDYDNTTAESIMELIRQYDDEVTTCYNVEINKLIKRHSYE